MGMHGDTVAPGTTAWQRSYKGKSCVGLAWVLIAQAPVLSPPKKTMEASWGRE